jgi:thiol-disulfide isomerase/thioredoxin
MKVFAFLFALLTLASAAVAETVLLDFTADWCGPCRTMAPVVAGLEREGYRVERIEVTPGNSKARQFNVQNIPTFVALKDGREVGRLVGIKSADELRRLLGPPSGAQARRPQNVKPQVRQVSDSAAPAAAPAAALSDQELIQRSVRLVLDDTRSRSFATGTVLKSSPGETLVLTCSHLFEGASRDAKPMVEFFGAADSTRLPGELVTRDRNADVALVRVEIKDELPAARVASRRFVLVSGMPSASVGCDNGQPPTVRRMNITAVNRYLGAPTIECSGQPVQGRSGGGLFNAAGEVIGVCSAAEPREKRGIYAGLAAIHALLDRQGLSELYETAPPAQVASARAGEKPLHLPLAVPPPEKLGLNVTAGLAMPESVDDPEAVCVIRSNSDPDAPAKVIMLNRVSPELLAQLQREQAAQESRATTSMRLPNRPEWRPVLRQPVADGATTAASHGSQ